MLNIKTLLRGQRLADKLALNATTVRSTVFVG
jgi:hypothetical protein